MSVKTVLIQSLLDFSQLITDVFFIQILSVVGFSETVVLRLVSSMLPLFEHRFLVLLCCLQPLFQLPVSFFHLVEQLLLSIFLCF